MTRLRRPPERVGTAPARLAPATPIDEADRTRQRAAAQPWRKWYLTKRWRTLRLEVLERDGYECQATGAPLTGRHPAPDAPVVDHVRPHRGDPALFWDPANLRAVSKDWHDRVKQRLERAGLV